MSDTELVNTETKQELTEMQKVHREYSILCSQLGEFTYKKKMFELDIETVTTRLKEVNKKAADLQAAAAQFEKKEQLNG